MNAFNLQRAFGIDMINYLQMDLPKLSPGHIIIQWSDWCIIKVYDWSKLTADNWKVKIVIIKVISHTLYMSIIRVGLSAYRADSVAHQK